MATKRKKWYYGPGIIRLAGQGPANVLYVFPSASEPTRASHGAWIKYAVGPFPTRKAAVHKAHVSQAHPGWRVYVKRSRYGLAERQV